MFTNMKDCNRCKYINITETKQRLEGNHIPHICLKYHTRVFHYSQKTDAYLIYPCETCLMDSFNRYIAGYCDE